MSNIVALPRIVSRVRGNVDTILSILLVLCIGSALSIYSPRIPWYLAVAIAAFAITLGISGQLILFSLAYKGWERWSRRRGQPNLSPFSTVVRVVFNGYIRSLWFFLAIALLLSLFHASLAEILRTFAFVFMGANICITFLSSNPRTWNENTSVPIVLSIGYAVQLVFLLLVKLIV